MGVKFSWISSLRGVGTRAALAQALHGWLSDVIPAAQPFMSDENIRSGQRWFGQVGGRLQKSDFAVLCITPNNINSTWMHFEAGAVSKNAAADSRVAALLLDVPTTMLQTPLSQFQHRAADRNGLLKLVLDIDEALGEQRRGADKTKKAFEAFWHELDESICKARELLKAGPVKDPGYPGHAAGYVAAY
jgi:hypothetical protein